MFRSHLALRLIGCAALLCRVVLAAEGFLLDDGVIVVPIAPEGANVIQQATTEFNAATMIASAPPPQSGAGVAGPVDGAPSQPDCNAQCSLFFQSIDVYFWETSNSNNTACLSGVTDAPKTGPPPDLNPISPSVYLVFPTVSAGNACTRVGNVYTSATLSFPPEALSTIVGTQGVVQPFNFNDLPCPPPEVASADAWFYNPAYNPGRAYAPMVSPPPELFALDEAFQNCVAAVYQGFDPPHALQHAAAPDGPGGFGRRKRVIPGHVVPHGPRQTPFTL